MEHTTLQKVFHVSFALIVSTILAMALAVVLAMVLVITADNAHAEPNNGRAEHYFNAQWTQQARLGRPRGPFEFFKFFCPLSQMYTLPTERFPRRGQRPNAEAELTKAVYYFDAKRDRTKGHLVHAR